jgi:hypothetical protein
MLAAKKVCYFRLTKSVVDNLQIKETVCSRTLLEHLYTSIVGAVRLSLSALLNIAQEGQGTRCPASVGVQ